MEGRAHTKEIFVRLLMKAGLDRDTALIVLGYAYRSNNRVTYRSPGDSLFGGRVPNQNTDLRFPWLRKDFGDVKGNPWDRT